MIALLSARNRRASAMRRHDLIVVEVEAFAGQQAIKVASSKMHVHQLLERGVDGLFHCGRVSQLTCLGEEVVVDNRSIVWSSVSQYILLYHRRIYNVELSPELGS